MSELTIGLILPDVLGTYGDNGNALVLRGRARKRGIDTEVVTIKLGEPVPTNLDLYCVGGGEDTAQILAAKHLTEHRGLIEAANLGRPIFAICAGLQVLGESFRADGRIVDGVGLIDATTSSLGKRTIGELIQRSEADLLDIRNFGAKSIEDVKDELAKLDLRLKDSPAGFVSTYGDESYTMQFSDDSQA